MVGLFMTGDGPNVMIHGDARLPRKGHSALALPFEKT